MSFRQELMKHLTALPVTDVKKLVSKYNKELDIKPISRLKKAEILAKISAKKPMDKQLLAKLTNEARATREGKKAQKASEKEAAKKPVEKFGTEKKKIKVKKAKPDFLDLDKDGDKKEPMKKAAKEAKKSKPKSQAEKKIAEVEKILIDLQERKKANEEKQKEIKDLLSKGGKNINKEKLEENLETLRKRLKKLESSIVFEKKEIASLKGESATTKTTNTITEELANKYIRYDTTKIINARNRIKMREYIEGVDFFGGPDKVPLDFVPKERIKMRYDIIKELLKKDILPKKSKPPFSKYVKENQSIFEKYQKEEEKKIEDSIPKMILDKYTKGQKAKIAKAAKDKAKTRMEKDYILL